MDNRKKIIEEIIYFFKEVFTKSKSGEIEEVYQDSSLERLLNEEEDIAEFVLFLEERYNIILKDEEIEEILRLSIKDLPDKLKKFKNSLNVS